MYNEPGSTLANARKALSVAINFPFKGAYVPWLTIPLLYTASLGTWRYHIQMCDEQSSADGRGPYSGFWLELRGAFAAELKVTRH